MQLNNDAEFEEALERVTAMLEHPGASADSGDPAFGELLAAVANYAPTAETSSAPPSAVQQRAQLLADHADKIDRVLAKARLDSGFGGLPVDGPGMGPSTGA